MKNLRLKMAVAALVLGVGSAMATAHNPFANRTWAKDSLGHYSDVTGQAYDCTPGTQVCTEDYPTGVNPNNQSTDSYPGIAQPSNVILGNFAQ